MKKLKNIIEMVKMALQKPDLYDIEIGCYIEYARDRWEDEENCLELKKEIDEMDLKCRRRFKHEDYRLVREYADLLDRYRICHGYYMYESALLDYKTIIKDYRNGL